MLNSDVLSNIYQHLNLKILKLLFTYHYPSFVVGASKSFWINFKKIKLIKEVDYCNPFTWMDEYRVCNIIHKNKYSHYLCTNNNALMYKNIAESICTIHSFFDDKFKGIYGHQFVLTNNVLYFYIAIGYGKFVYLSIHNNIQKLLYYLFKLKLIKIDII